MKHKKVKKTLQILGVTFLIIGFGFAAGGLIDFFVAFNTMGVPNFFWLAFIGFPLLGLGAFMTIFGFHKEVSKYIADEKVSVDANYIKGIKPSIVDPCDGNKTCANCGHINGKDDIYCSECGSKLTKTVCPKCGADIESDDKFCPNCGQKLAK